ncbi:hypothetical protein PUV54_06625 [Hyphococcus flavus]|uniref:Uncharacterized protein n=1 Tax=Hyphococcus flavus TaxID=1866326 RepID=A0AAE9ZFH8_9PROT|nr:hypothetical protein [Hyphococcus flavus]WDI32870.1 hypothetical protein PUV54_06625 [Hyphococcus flavus]
MSVSDATLGGGDALLKKSALTKNPYLLVALPLAVFWLFSTAIGYAAATPGAAPVLVVLSVAAAVPFAHLRASEFLVFQRRFLQLSAGLLVVYLLSEPFNVPVITLEAHHPAAMLHAYGRWLGAVLAMLAVFRPVFLAPAAGLAWLLRGMNEMLTGFEFSVLDVEIVFEVLVFAALGFLFVRMLARSGAVSENVELKAGVLIAAIAVGAHFGNYFHSAIAKIALDGGMLSWIMDNRLYDGMLGAIEKGTFPFAASAMLTQTMFDALHVANVPFHLLSFAAQFAAILCVARRKWVIAITLVYDAFHIGVFLVYGLLFWKWIALNAILIAMTAAIPKGAWTRRVSLVCALFVIGGGVFFTTARLAWYDAPAFASRYFEAVDGDGVRYRVPSAYFGSASYQVSHGKFYPPVSQGHFSPSVWGSVKSQEPLLARRNCRPAQDELQTAASNSEIAALKAYVWANHAALLRAADNNGQVNPYAYLHHHFPTLFVKRDIDNADLRNITDYIFVVESVCLDLDNGRLTRNIINRDEIHLGKAKE